MGGAAGFFPEKMNFPHKKDQEEGHRDLMIDFLAIKSLMGRQRESVRQKSREVAGGPCAPRAAVSGYYPKQFIDSMQSLSNYQRYSSQS